MIFNWEFCGIIDITSKRSLYVVLGHPSPHWRMISKNVLNLTSWMKLSSVWREGKSLTFESTLAPGPSATVSCFMRGSAKWRTVHAPLFQFSISSRIFLASVLLFFRFSSLLFFRLRTEKDMIYPYCFEKSVINPLSVLPRSSWTVKCSGVIAAASNRPVAYFQNYLVAQFELDFGLWENRESSFDWATRGFWKSTRNVTPNWCRRCASASSTGSHKSARVCVFLFFSK